ncbi:MAG: bifunctional anthranilate synthase component II/anthranilate phosphoribosyltransferase [Treponema sp.]|jgi:anthranilate synthase/phosphoribosyltransferase|nr:MAG: bifunctional anthranilate synthase component II/anthranilate phosphoribosyltransferase [Treponema sp.]
MIVLIDNYDSFTYNVYQYLARLSREEIRVVRNDSVTIADLEKLSPSRLVVSPGPGRPEDAGISVEAIRHFAGKIPVLGVCLGHQAIGCAFGGKIVGAKFIKHGIAEEMSLDGRGVFRTVGTKGTFTRYHSLVIEEASLPDCLEVTARAVDGDIMGVRHKQFDVEGVQFHPESIASTQGEAVLRAFLSYRREGLSFSKVLSSLMAGKSMSRETAELFMEDLTEGSLDERQTSAILTAISAKGPSAEEIAGCAAVLCRKKTPVPIQADLTDIVGTGGDGIGSFNISSLAALVAAACGVPIAKHGNRAVSSKSGSADFYEALGIKIDISADKTAAIIEKTGFGFLFAPVYHSAMRFAAPVRKLLGVKTIMNLVGPLSNPAGAQYQMLGVYEKSLLRPVAEASKMLGARRVMVVVSRDGMDEISCAAVTDVVEIGEDGVFREYTIDPADFGIRDCPISDLLGGDSRENASLALDALQGRGRQGIVEAVALNAAATLYISGCAPTFKEGYARAKAAIADGSVLKKIDEVREASCA